MRKIRGIEKLGRLKNRKVEDEEMIIKILRNIIEINNCFFVINTIQ